MKTLSVFVWCAECGKIVRGNPHVSGIKVRWHRLSDGRTRCKGEHRFDHRPTGGPK